MILIPTTPKHQETRYGAIQQPFAHLKMRQKAGIHTSSCKGDDHSVVEDIFQKELEILLTKGGFFIMAGLSILYG